MKYILCHNLFPSTVEVNRTLAKASDVRSVGVECLDAVVSAVRHEDVALLVHGHAPVRQKPRPLELSASNRLLYRHGIMKQGSS